MLRIIDNLIVSCSHDKTVKLWRVTEEKCFNTLRDGNYYYYSLIFTEGKLLAGSHDGTVVVWN